MVGFVAAHSSRHDLALNGRHSTMFTVKALSLSAACHHYREDWRRIVEVQKLNPSLGPAWQSITAISHGVSESCRVMIVTSAEEVVAIIPYLVSKIPYRGIALREFSLLSNLVCYHNELVTTIPLAEVCSLIVLQEPNCDVFRLSALFSRTGDASDVATSIANLVDVQVFDESGDASPYLPISGTWDDLFARQHKKFRYKIRRRIKRLDENDSLSIQWYEHQSDTAEFLERIQQIERRSWKFRAGIDISARHQELKYHELLLPWLADSGHLVAGVLLVDDRPAAYTIACSWPSWTGFSKTSFDAEFAELEPGAILTEATLRKCMRRGTQEFDFLGNADRYKLSWTKRVRKHFDLTLYNKRKMKGWTIGAVKGLWRRISSSDPQKNTSS